jgi:glutamine cyclotransferase
MFRGQHTPFHFLSFPVFVTFLWLVQACTCSPELPGISTTTNDDKSVFIPASPGYQVMAEYPHDTKAYTQGLIWYNNHLLEGTGQVKESNLRKVDLTTGKVLKQANNDDNVFGEGITELNGKIYQLTWQNKKGYVYDAVTFKKLSEFPLNTEGWGITTNGTELIYSDGSSNLYFLDTSKFREIKRIGVTDNFGPVSNLNELEWIDGFVWANRWQTDIIYKIDPTSGRVVARVDFSGLKETGGLNLKDANSEVLNGIAWDSVGKRLFITGKYWPKLFEVKIAE